MTVEELIEILEELDPTMPVVLSVNHHIRDLDEVVDYSENYGYIMLED